MPLWHMFQPDVPRTGGGTMTRPPDANVEQCDVCQKWNDSDMAHCRYCGHRLDTSAPPAALESVPLLKSPRVPTGGPERAREPRLGIRNRNGTPLITRGRVALLIPKLTPFGHSVIYVRKPKPEVKAEPTAAVSAGQRYMERYGWYLLARSIVRAIVGTYRFGVRHWVGLAPWYGCLLALVAHGLWLGMPDAGMAQWYAIASGTGAIRWYTHRYRYGPRGVAVVPARTTLADKWHARRTARKMVRDWLIYMRNADMVGTELRRITFDEWSVTMDIHTTHKVGVQEIRARLDKLERCFPNTLRNSSRVETRGKLARDARLRFMLKDPFAESIPLLDHDGNDHMIPIGRFETGQTVLINILQHLLIAGMSGSGKSNLQQIILRMLTRISWVAVVAVDLSPGAPEFGRWDGRVAAVVSSIDDLRHALGVLREGLNRRGDLMKERGWQKWHPTAAEPHIVFMVDEVQALTHAKLGDELDDVAALLRKYGGTLILATQHPKNDNLPSSTKAQMRQTIGLRTKTADNARVIFGQDADKEGWNTKKLDNNSFLIETEQDGYREPLRAKGSYLSEEDLAYEIMTTPRRVKVDVATWPIDHLTVPEIEAQYPERDIVDSYVIDPSNMEKVYEYLRDTETHRVEIERATGLDQKTVDKYLRKLIEQGRAEKIKRARYRRT